MSPYALWTWMNLHFDSLKRNEHFASFTLDFHQELSSSSLQCGWFYPAAGYKLWLILCCGWLEFWQLDKSCGWFYPAADSSSSGWIRVVDDSILQLTRVPAAGYELRLIQSCKWLEFLRLDTSCGWLEFRQLNMSCGWFYPAAGSNSGG